MNNWPEKKTCFNHLLVVFVSYFVNVANMSLLNEIERYVKTKDVRKALHPTQPLAIYNYTDVVQYAQKWTSTLMRCRGLVMDLETEEIVAPPMQKFFNYEEQKHASCKDNAAFDVMEKMDGSLGIYFWYKTQWIFASRGSFTSEQAQEGAKLAIEADLSSMCDKELTYIFEIIYPQNKIVVDYGTRRELVLLAVLDRTHGGNDLPLAQVKDIASKLHVATPRTFDGQEVTPEMLKAQNKANEEGYVIRFRATGERVKIKFQNYVDLHRIVTNFSLDHVKTWFLEDPQRDITEKVHLIPDELYNEVKTTWSLLLNMYAEQKQRFRDTALSYKDVEFKDVPKDDVFHKLICKSLRLSKHHDSAYEPTVESVADEFARAWIKTNHKTSDSVTLKTSLPLTPPQTLRSTMLILVGVSGSGKSTFARSYCARLCGKGMIISRDHIRKMFAAPLDENLVTQLMHTLIRQGIRAGKQIIIDNTNLRSAYIKQFYKQYKNLVADIRVRCFDVPLATCITRDANRHPEEKVGEDVIRKQAKEYEHITAIKPWIKFAADESKICESHAKNENSSANIVIFDIDGTLALNLKGRSYYDETRVMEDAPNEPVVATCKTIAEHYKIIVCTGRSEACRTLTEQWLRAQSIPYEALYMRPHKDVRNDATVKQEMWSKIEQEHKSNIMIMFDDRCSVVDHARSLGYTVAQVESGCF